MTSSTDSSLPSSLGLDAIENVASEHFAVRLPKMVFNRIPPEIVEELAFKAKERVRRFMNKSTHLKNHCRLNDIPQFKREDFTLGKKIARGGFADVYEIKSFAVETELKKGDNKKGKYVVKKLQRALIADDVIGGGRDLVSEAVFLSSFNHENILKLRGWTADGIHSFAKSGRADGFFLIYDELEETLYERICRWRMKSKSLAKVTKHTMKGLAELFTERIRVALDLAGALDYLHKRRILYRDLKPSNVGFDRDGVVKLFDFGLATVLPECEDEDALFLLNGNVGTTRYMAVEVMRSDAYNYKADVFSFAVTLWSMMAMRKPFEEYTTDEVQKCVAMHDERPPIPETWPDDLSKLICRGWSTAPSDRPHMAEVREVLEGIYQESKLADKALSCSKRGSWLPGRRRVSMRGPWSAAA